MKLLHFADVHLGMENYGRLNPVSGLYTCFEDGMRRLSFMVDLAIERHVDTAIFTGDAYRTCDPTHRHGFAEQMRRLIDAGISLVRVPVNHDMPIAFGRKTALDIFAALGTDRVHVLTRQALQVIPTRSGSLQIAAFPWPLRTALLGPEELRGVTKRN